MSKDSKGRLERWARLARAVHAIGPYLLGIMAAAIAASTLTGLFSISIVVTVLSSVVIFAVLVVARKASSLLQDLQALRAARMVTESEYKNLFELFTRARGA